MEQSSKGALSKIFNFENVTDDGFVYILLVSKIGSVENSSVWLKLSHGQHSME